MRVDGNLWILCLFSELLVTSETDIDKMFAIQRIMKLCNWTAHNRFLLLVSPTLFYAEDFYHDKETLNPKEKHGKLLTRYINEALNRLGVCVGKKKSCRF